MLEGESVLMLCVSGEGIRFSYLKVTFCRVLANRTGRSFQSTRHSAAFINGRDVEVGEDTK